MAVQVTSGTATNLAEFLLDIDTASRGGKSRVIAKIREDKVQ